jgi:hypothetical protein
MSPLHKTLTIVASVLFAIIAINLLGGVSVRELGPIGQLIACVSFSWLVYTAVGGRV